MPDTNNGNTNTSTGGADILSSLNNYFNSTTASRNDTIALLKSIDQTTKQILQSGRGMSASNAQNMMPGYRSSNTYFQSRAGYSSRGGSSSFSKFTDGLESVLLDELVGREFKDKLRGIRDKLARDIGVNIEDVPNALGKALGSKLAGAIKNTDIFKM